MKHKTDLFLILFYFTASTIVFEVAGTAVFKYVDPAAKSPSTQLSPEGQSGEVVLRSSIPPALPNNLPSQPPRFFQPHNSGIDSLSEITNQRRMPKTSRLRSEAPITKAKTSLGIAKTHPGYIVPVKPFANHESYGFRQTEDAKTTPSISTFLSLKNAKASANLFKVTSSATSSAPFVEDGKVNLEHTILPSIPQMPFHRGDPDQARAHGEPKQGKRTYRSEKDNFRDQRKHHLPPRSKPTAPERDSQTQYEEPTKQSPRLAMDPEFALSSGPRWQAAYDRPQHVEGRKSKHSKKKKKSHSKAKDPADSGSPAIVAGVFAGILVVTFIITGLVRLWRRCRKRRNHDDAELILGTDIEYDYGEEEVLFERKSKEDQDSGLTSGTSPAIPAFPSWTPPRTPTPTPQTFSNTSTSVIRTATTSGAPNANSKMVCCSSLKGLIPPGPSHSLMTWTASKQADVVVPSTIRDMSVMEETYDSSTNYSVSRYVNTWSVSIPAETGSSSKTDILSMPEDHSPSGILLIPTETSDLSKTSAVPVQVETSGMVLMPTETSDDTSKIGREDISAKTSDFSKSRIQSFQADATDSFNACIVSIPEGTLKSPNTCIVSIPADTSDALETCIETTSAVSSPSSSLCNFFVPTETSDSWKTCHLPKWTETSNSSQVEKPETSNTCGGEIVSPRISTSLGQVDSHDSSGASVMHIRVDISECIDSTSDESWDSLETCPVPISSAGSRSSKTCLVSPSSTLSSSLTKCGNTSSSKVVQFLLPDEVNAGSVAFAGCATPPTPPPGVPPPLCATTELKQGKSQIGGRRGLENRRYIKHFTSGEYAADFKTGLNQAVARLLGNNRGLADQSKVKRRVIMHQTQGRSITESIQRAKSIILDEMVDKTRDLKSSERRRVIRRAILPTQRRRNSFARLIAFSQRVILPSAEERIAERKRKERRKVIRVRLSDYFHPSLVVVIQIAASSIAQDERTLELNRKNRRTIEAIKIDAALQKGKSSIVSDVPFARNIISPSASVCRKGCFCYTCLVFKAVDSRQSVKDASG